MKHIIPILVILLLLSSGFVGVCSNPLTAYNAVDRASVLDDISFNSSLYLPHRTIHINGNDDFTIFNGVTSGSGTKNNPYVIKGWIIRPNLFKAGITIQNVDAYFVIKNCYIRSIITSGTGIRFTNVINGIIENNVITENNLGIIFYPGEDGEGESSYNIIRNNSITKNTWGISFEHTSSEWHSHNIITNNNISDNEVGIYMIMSAYNQIIYNNITSNRWGIDLFMCVGGGEENKIHHNNFIENKNSQTTVIGEPINYWDNGYPSGGNYWSDYTGEDFFSGPNQNIPGSDGIGDIPYVISSYPGYENNDSYPFMEPLDINFNIYNFEEIENSINPFTKGNNNEVLHQQTQNVWYLRWLERFPLLQWLLDILGWYT